MRAGNPIGFYGQQERIKDSTRTQPSWLEVEVAWEETQHILISLIKNIQKIAQGLAEVISTLPEEIEANYLTLTNIYRQLSEINDNINAFVFEPDEGTIYWIDIEQKKSKITLNAAPIHIGSLMQQYIWYEKSSVVLTSATLTTVNGFDYIRERLNAFDADELRLGSPYDFENSALLYLVDDIPEPIDRTGFQKAVQSGLINLSTAIGGKTLALFTSYDQLKKTSREITPILSKHGIIVYEQGDGSSPHILVEKFRSSSQAVLLGTRALWEGVDIPGEPLSALVIVKLPFDVPSDPIIAARSETFEDPFYQYSLPEAVLRFKQGFGRLIRSQSDRGIVAIFDRRILTKRYGKIFLESLPPSKIEIGHLSQLPKAATDWLNL